MADPTQNLVPHQKTPNRAPARAEALLMWTKRLDLVPELPFRDASLDLANFYFLYNLTAKHYEEHIEDVCAALQPV